MKSVWDKVGKEVGGGEVWGEVRREVWNGPGREVWIKVEREVVNGVEYEVRSEVVDKREELL